MIDLALHDVSVVVGLILKAVTVGSRTRNAMYAIVAGDCVAARVAMDARMDQAADILRQAVTCDSG